MGSYGEALVISEFQILKIKITSMKKCKYRLLADFLKLHKYFYFLIYWTDLGDGRHWEIKSRNKAHPIESYCTIWALIGERTRRHNEKTGSTMKYKETNDSVPFLSKIQNMLAFFQPKPFHWKEGSQMRIIKAQSSTKKAQKPIEAVSGSKFRSVNG